MMSCAQEKKTETIMGYEYEHLIKTGAQKPQPGEYVLYNYYLKDDKGEVLENSKSKQPFATFRIPPANAYPKKAALIELMKVMSVGDSARMFYPIDSLPAEGRERFGETKQLIYEIVIQEVKTEEQYASIKEAEDKERQKQIDASKGLELEAKATVDATLADFKAGNLEGKLQEINGVKYVINEEGSGDKAKVGSMVNAHYYGVLQENGNMFDNSFSRGTPFSFTVGKGQVIQGWDEGFKALNPGAKATLFIPYTMAYGEQGRPPMIPAKSDLVFYVEVLDVK